MKVIAFKIVVNGIERVITNSKELKQAFRDVRKELETATFGTPAFEKLKRTEAELININQRLKKETKETTNELKRQSTAANALDGDFEQLSAELAVLTQRWRLMGKEARNSLDGQALSKQIRQVKDELSDIRRAGAGRTSFLGNIQEQFGFFLRGGLVLEGINAITNGLRRMGGAIVDVNSQTSDLLAEVQRVAGLSRFEVRQLFDELESLDTRTPTTELINFAAIGGRLGIANDELAGFSEALDNISVAFSGTLGNDAEDLAEKLGKINNIFGGTFGDLTDTVPEKLTSIGNALIALDNAGVAAPQFLVDFTNRLAGLREIADISLGQTLGLAAGFDELGQTAEVSSTAVNSIILQIGKDLPLAAQLAGLEVEELRELYENDIVEALLAFSKGLVENSRDLDTGAVSTEELSQKLKDFRIGGRRAAATVGVLGGNVDLFRKRVELANGELGETDQITDAVNLKQETLAGTVERLKNAFNDLLNSPGVQDFLQGIVSGVTDAINAVNDFFNPLGKLKRELGEQSATVAELQEKLPGLTAEYEKLSASTDPSDQERLKEVIAEIGRLTPGAVTQVDQYGNAIAIAASKVDILAEAERKRFGQLQRQNINERQQVIDSLEADIARLRDQIERGRLVTNPGERTAQRIPLSPQGIAAAQAQLRELNAELATSQQEMFELSGAFFDLGENATDATETANAATDGLTPAVARNVSLIRGEIKALNDELENAETRDEAASIQNQIKTLNRELESILGKGNLKGFKDTNNEVAGSLAHFNRRLKELEERLQNTASAETYVATLRKIQEVTNELIQKQREFNEAAIVAAGGSITPAALPQTQVSDIQGTLQQVADELLSEDVEKERLQRVLELSEEFAKESNEIFLKERKGRFEEEVKIEQDLQAERFEILGESLEALGQLTGQAIEGELDNFQEFLKGVLLIYIDALEKLLVAEATARASVAAVAGDFSAIARAAIAIGTIKGAFAIVKSAINAATAEEGIVYSGSDREGHTGHGSPKQSAGLIEVHKDEAVAVFPQRMMHHPKGQALMKDFQYLKKSLGYRAPTTSRMGFQEGGVASLTSPSPVQQAIIVKAIVSLDEESVSRVENAVKTGSEGGSKAGIMGAAKENRRREELSRKTGF